MPSFIISDGEAEIDEEKKKTLTNLPHSNNLRHILAPESYQKLESASLIQVAVSCENYTFLIILKFNLSPHFHHSR